MGGGGWGEGGSERARAKARALGNERKRRRGGERETNGNGEEERASARKLTFDEWGVFHRVVSAARSSLKTVMPLGPDIRRERKMCLLQIETSMTEIYSLLSALCNEQRVRKFFLQERQVSQDTSM